MPAGRLPGRPVRAVLRGQPADPRRYSWSTRRWSRASRSTRRSSTLPAPIAAVRARPAHRRGHPHTGSASELGLACSVGVAPVKFLAKLASEAAKPTADPRGTRARAGVVVIRPGRSWRFLHPLPIEALWGVGPATATRLRRLGVTTVGDLARVPAEVLEAAVGRANGAHLPGWLGVSTIGRRARPGGQVDQPRGDLPGRPSRPRRARPGGGAHGRRGRHPDAPGRWSGGRSPSRSASATSRPGPGRAPTRPPCRTGARSPPGRGAARRGRQIRGIRLLGVGVSNLVGRQPVRSSR